MGGTFSYSLQSCDSVKKYGERDGGQNAFDAIYRKFDVQWAPAVKKNGVKKNQAEIVEKKKEVGRKKNSSNRAKI